MAVFTLETLVLRGVSVRCDGKTVELRRGASAQTTDWTPEIPFSMRRPSQGVIEQTEHDQLATRQHHDHLMVARVAGAGRSLRSIGACGRRSLASNARRLTLNALSPDFGSFTNPAALSNPNRFDDATADGNAARLFYRWSRSASTSPTPAVVGRDGKRGPVGESSYPASTLGTAAR
jgi:hypothetical protein